MSYTPGPWRFGGCIVWGNDNGRGDGDLVTDISGTAVYRDPDEVEANARLISAAPELGESYVCRKMFIDTRDKGEHLSQLTGKTILLQSIHRIDRTEVPDILRPFTDDNQISVRFAVAPGEDS